MGFVPSCIDGSEVVWDAERREVVNTRHGSLRQPRLPSEPASDSPWIKVLSDFGKLRGRMDVRPDGVLGALLIEQ